MSKKKNTTMGFEALEQKEISRSKSSENCEPLSDEQVMNIARKVMREDKEVLKKLAE